MMLDDLRSVTVAVLFPCAYVVRCCGCYVNVEDNHSARSLQADSGDPLR
jgi:hypothetical protein